MGRFLIKFEKPPKTGFKRMIKYITTKHEKKFFYYGTDVKDMPGADKFNAKQKEALANNQTLEMLEAAFKHSPVLWRQKSKSCGCDNYGKWNTTLKVEIDNVRDKYAHVQPCCHVGVIREMRKKRQIENVKGLTQKVKDFNEQDNGSEGQVQCLKALRAELNRNNIDKGCKKIESHIERMYAGSPYMRELR